MNALTKLTDATRMLAEVRSAPDAKKVMDMAAAAEHYARKAKLGDEAIQYAREIKIDAETMLGEFLAKAPKASGTRAQLVGDIPKGEKVVGGTKREPPTPKLEDIGLTKKESSVDLFVEIDRKFLIGEFKAAGNPVPMGQRMALERMVRKFGEGSILFFAEHSSQPGELIDAASARVVEWFPATTQKWQTPEHELSVAELSEQWVRELGYSL